MDQLEMGLTLAIDYNEERQLLNTNEKNASALKEYFINENQDNPFAVYLDTISILYSISNMSRVYSLLLLL